MHQLDDIECGNVNVNVGPSLRCLTGRQTIVDGHIWTPADLFHLPGAWVLFHGCCCTGEKTVVIWPAGQGEVRVTIETSISHEPAQRSETLLAAGNGVRIREAPEATPQQQARLALVVKRDRAPIASPQPAFLRERRYYYMDSMRSVLIVLGVVLHASNVYRVTDDWIVRDSNGSIVFDLISEGIHVFRMPSFFIVSGFFACLTLGRYSTSTFLQVRFKRIAIPLLCTAVLLNSVESYVKYTIADGAPLGFWSYVYWELPATWLNGNWVSHLWFLNYLITYSLLAPTICALMPLCAAHPILVNFGRQLRTNGRFLLVLPLFPMTILLANRCHPGLIPNQFWNGAFDTYELLDYFSFFAFGMFLYRSEPLQHVFNTPRTWHVVAFIASIFVLAADQLPVASIFLSAGASPAGTLISVLTAISAWQATVWGHGLSAYAVGIASWTGCLFCFRFFRYFLNRPTRFFRYFADASYTVYLFHHLCVILLGYYLLRVPIPAWTKFSLVVLSSLGLTLAIHHFLILRSRTLRLLFNGK